MTSATDHPQSSPQPHDGHLSAAGSNDRFVTHSELPQLDKRHIAMVGMSTWTAQSYSFSRCHELSQLVAVISGRCEFWVNGQWRRAGAGDLFLCPARGVGGVRVRQRKMRFVAVLYSQAAVESLIAAEPVLAEADVWGLEHAAGGLLREWAAAAPANVLECLIDLVDVQAVRLMGQEPAPGRLADLWETVEQDIGSAWALERMAGLMGLSEQHLSRLCHSEHNDSPVAHLAKLRMRRAAQLLQTTETSIAALSALVGYQSQFAFSNAFKRHFKISPLAYRKAHRQGEAEPPAPANPA
ncbi:MAG: AraC family transcriptional regulator [Planctomycetaceae bacterium]|nr:AraC family transcriptional regulator [Planctomycetaceae bacterium]